MARIEVTGNGSPRMRRSVLELPAVRTPLFAPSKRHPCSGCMPLLALPRLWLRGWQTSFPAQHLRGAAHSAWNSDVGRRESGTHLLSAQPQRAQKSTQELIGSGTTACPCNISNLTSFQGSQRGRRSRMLLPPHFAAHVSPYNWTGRRSRRLHLRGLGASPLAVAHGDRILGSTPNPLAHAAPSLCGGPMAQHRRTIGTARLGVAAEGRGRIGQLVGMIRAGDGGEGT